MSRSRRWRPRCRQSPARALPGEGANSYEQVYRLGPYCNAVVCVSERIRENVNALNPVIGASAHVIHNTSVREADLGDVGGRADESPVMRLIYSGRLVQYQKRILDFVTLAEELDREGIAYELSLVGTFSPRERTEAEFRARAAEHLDDGRIKLLGRKSRAEIFRELDEHHFFVLLSDFEGLPLSLVEAMARGCVPVVAESPSGISELIDPGLNGLIVRGRDYGEWARLLAEIRSDPEGREAMARRAQEKVRAGFTVERVADRFEELFTRVAENVASGAYQRPPSLNWGRDRSQTGDVLAPPNLHRPAALQLPGLQ
jgi:glycosyltransferase involved in cell wall biosynthesis